MKKCVSVSIMVAIVFLLGACSVNLITTPSGNENNSENPAITPPGSESDSGNPAITPPSSENNGGNLISTEDIGSSMPAPSYPDQSYVGTWYTDEDKLDDLRISEINTDTIKFEMGIFRLMGMSATAKLVNNQVKFGEDISPDYDGPTMSGTLEFNENSISVIIDESEFEYIKAGTVYYFTVKDEN